MTILDSGHIEKTAGTEQLPESSRDDEQHRFPATDHPHREPGPDGGDAPSATPELAPLQELEANRRLVELLLAQRWSVIQAAREDGASWGVIGSALGISRQGAHDWYTRKINERDRAGTEIECLAPRTTDDPSRDGERVTPRVVSRRVVHRGENTHPRSESHPRTDPEPEHREWSSAPFVDGGRAS